MAGPSNNQAVDDSRSYSEQSFTGNLLFDVRANDPLRKALHSIDDGQVADLATADLARSAAASSDRSALGATIWITSDGRIGYAADSISDLVNQLAAGETLVDSFLYSMKQGGSIVWATARITITGTNDAPVARADTGLAIENAVTTGSVASNDGDVDHGAVLQYAVVGQAPAGFVMAPNGAWAFDGSNPAYQSLPEGHQINQLVQYSVTDEHGASSSSYLTLTIVGTNDAPVVTDTVTGAASEDGAGSTLSALANASDVDAGASLSVVDVPAALPDGVSFDAATQSFTLDPSHAAYQSLAEGATIAVSVSYGVSDGIATTSASVRWTITGTNDAPVVTGVVAGTAAEDGAASTLAALANASDADAGALLSVVDVPAELPPGVSYDPESRSFTLDPTHATYQSLGAGATATVSVSYGVSDGAVTTPGSVSWTVTGTNDGPVATAATAAVAEGQAVGGTLVATDADADASLIFEPYWGGPDGFALAADGSWTFDANQAEYHSLAEGESRDVAIEYVVTDDQGETSVSTLTVTVNGTNDGPVVTGAVSGAAAEDGAASTLAALANASDADAGAVLSVVDVPAELPPGVTYDPASRSFTLDPAHAAYQSLAEGATATVSVSYGVSDGAVTTPGSVSWTVTGANDGPTAAAATATVAEDGFVSGTVIVSDPDANASLTVEPRYDSPNWFEMDSDGNWTFDANQYEYQSLAEGETRDVVINYDVADAEGAYAYSTLTVTVTGVNDAPVTTSQWAEAVEGETAAGTLIAIDQDNGAQRSFAVDGEAPAGFVLNADGSWSFDTANAAYDGLAGGEVRLIRVPFTVTDEHGGASSSFMMIALTGSNDAPVFDGAPIALPAGTEDTAYLLTHEQLLAGWTDPDGEMLSIADPTVTNGSVVANADGTFTVTPNANFSGQMQLSYNVTDGRVSQVTGGLLTIAAVNDPATNFTGNLSGSLREDAIANLVSGRVTFTDVDSSNIFRAVATPQASDLGYGSFTLNSSGTWQYQVNNGNPVVDALATGSSLTDTISLVTADGTVQKVTITIVGRTDWTYVTPTTNAGPDPADEDGLQAGMTSPTPVNIAGSDSSSTLHGSNNADSIVGGGGSTDNIFGHGGNDVIYGDWSDPAGPTSSTWIDQIRGQAGDDTIYGGLGSDRLFGGSGNDVLYGNGTNQMESANTSEWMVGGSGNDILVGGEGSDWLEGGYGADQLTGGAGADRFVFVRSGDTGDTITDFQQGVDWLSCSGFSSSFRGAIGSPTQLDPGQSGYIIANGMTTIYFDFPNTAPGIDFEITLLGSYNLNSSDFSFS